ncbi:hypothetical protein MJO29_007134 [Puccinia striiformis f. sp. tritici]|uniref:hypothetical protein n=1 Tax=Puccinia striiformis f. sp. tritici TaxID=168172 RepID=UPI002008434E|nr:hypothetical protein Pst134EA_013264 [Puccinia striiformis f. sp. tritici]KAH9465378.1 hypothetical protein Pst134EA_013264 [Puccinia striiformis f. sp. tritici]KAI7955735.1 hypothetical protein MJO29_007134 [Puccinia striiformis f. sp. tritici]
MSIDARQSNASLDLSGKTAVVTGATQGIGEGIALRCAQLGASRIFVVGRNQERGNAVLERLRAVANERADSKQQFEFIKADLSTIKTIKQTASEIQKKVGTNGLDYLLMTQGGPPNGVYEENSEGYEKSLVVHCLSRFGLSYLLAEAKTLKKESTVVSILSPGSSYSDIDLEDLSLKKLHETDPWRATMLMSQGKRDSTLTDAFTLEFNRRYPSIKFYHLFPGYVQTNAAANRGLPFPIPQLGSLFGPIVAKIVGNTPTSYSDIPLFFAANPEARKLDGYLFNERINKIDLGEWNRDQTNRQKVFEKLRSLF